MPACVQPGTRRGFEPPPRTPARRRRAQFPAVLASIPLGPWSPATTFRLIFVAPAAAALFGFVAAAAQDASVSETGLASWYGPEFKGRPTASGESYNPSYLTAAHRSLPFGSLVHVQNLDNQRDMVVRINDRGPFVRGRILDLSQAAAEVLGFRDRGVARVRITAVQPPSPAPAAVKAPANATPAGGTAVPAAAGQAHEDGAAAPPDTMATPADPAAFGLAKPDFTVESIPTKTGTAPATTAQNTQPSPAAPGAPQPAGAASAGAPAAASAAAPGLANATSPAPATTTPGATKAVAPTTAAAPKSAAPMTAAAPHPAAPKTATAKSSAPMATASTPSTVSAPSGEATASTKSTKTGSAADYYVQIGAFRDAPGAKGRADTAAHLGVQLRTEFTGGLYRVLAGPYARRDQANQVQANFARSGIEGFVRTFSPEDFESPVGSR
jgi:peptidoglycan lytic transglycosylase